MNPEAKTLLVEALESGKYKQGEGVLKRTDEYSGENFHCCLGVLTELAVVAGVDVKVETPQQAEYKEYWLFDGGYEVLPKGVQEWAGIDAVGSIGDGEHAGSCLAELNDNGMPFKEIVEVIKEQF